MQTGNQQPAPKREGRTAAQPPQQSEGGTGAQAAQQPRPEGQNGAPARQVRQPQPTGNAGALLPIGVFLVLYLGLGVLFEYVLGIPMGFYSIPIVVVFLVALLVACVQNRALPFDDKLAVMGRGMGDKTIVTMILIFMAAGVFVGTVGRDSAESVAYLLLSVVPPQFAVAVLFVVSCFVSLSMGTSVGTITLIVPIAVAVSAASGFDLPSASQA